MEQPECHNQRLICVPLTLRLRVEQPVAVWLDQLHHAPRTGPLCTLLFSHPTLRRAGGAHADGGGLGEDGPHGGEEHTAVSGAQRRVHP